MMEWLASMVAEFVGWVRSPSCDRNPTTSTSRGMSGYDRQDGWSNPTYGRSLTLAGIFSLAAVTAALAQTPLVEPPMFAEAIKAGKLPPVEKRVPIEPSVVTFDGGDKTPGRYGGMMTQLMERSSDIKRMSAYGYARLVGYTPDYRIEADLLKSFEVKDGRAFTFKLRKGHRWSDGEPFTTEDFRYYWEDMVSNKEMSPEGPPKEMMVDGQPPKVEILDKETIRYTWDNPNPFFLPALAGATPLMIYRPAHYLKRFHSRYVKPDKLAAEIQKRKRRDWVDLHFNRDRTARLDNPDIPVLDPWVNTTQSPSERFIFERNPYYHRIDQAGLQLPYVDRIAVTIAASKLIPAKVGAGEAELQSRALQFNNYTVLKRAETRQDYKVRLWRNARGSQIALYPNLNVADDGWRALMRDVRFRRALSLAIDRREINMVIYYGLARESANTVMAESPLFQSRTAEDVVDVRSRPGQPAAGRRRPQAARQPRRPPDAGRPAGRDHRRDRRRRRRAYRRSRTCSRHLDQGRCCAFHQAADARGDAPPGQGWHGGDVGVLRLRQWHRQCRHAAERAGADDGGPAAVVAVGHVAHLERPQRCQGRCAGG